MDYTKEMLLSAAENASALAPEVVASVFRDFADALEKLKVAEEALLKCREEFCWHGNTGKTLSASAYGSLVDEVDAALARIRGTNA